MKRIKTFLKRRLGLLRLCSLLLVLGPALSGCAHEVHSLTYTAPSMPLPAFRPGTSFSVASQIQTVNPLFEETVKKKIEAALRSKGYQVPGPESADYHLEFAYDLEGESRTRFVPARRAVLVPQLGFIGGYHHSSFSTNMGFTTYINEDYSVYTGKLRLRVSRPSTTGVYDPADIVWIGEIWSKSEEPHLKTVIDYLITAAMNVFGERTEDSVTLKIDRKDPLLLLLKNTANSDASAPNMNA